MPFSPAARVANFGTSVFTEITQLALQHNAIDLSSGFPDTDGPEVVKEAAIDAIRAGRNQYALSHGTADLRRAIVDHARRFYGQKVNVDTEVTVTNGAAEALHSVMDGLVNPGEEVIILEPFYEVFAPNVIMAGGAPRFVPLRPTRPSTSPLRGFAQGASLEWTFDPDELAAAYNNRTRAIIVNTPHNPTGKVLSRAELETIATLCQKWNVIAIADEVYEHIVFDGAQHIRLATLPGMAGRTVTISSMSKTFSFTGWRIGWVIAPPDLTNAVRLAHQFVLDCSATPMQHGATSALLLEDDYYAGLAADYRRKRDHLAAALRDSGFDVSLPAAGFFIMAGIKPLGWDDDVAFCKYLAAEVGVAAIPPSAFFSDAHKGLGRGFARFAYCKTMETLEAARERLKKLTHSASFPPLRREEGG
ncbi:MAG TPA: aminotransferase class I/II-fold pyridoxal phosphate-dependent enzyme [Anaerolineales bacterium]|nr:aminotransferase class I/II-fold pyridoxal phosphate-dependent enzyme [Anaerolineales bacterium]